MGHFTSLNFWIGFLILMGIMLIVLSVAWVVYATQEKPPHDLIDTELESRNNVRINTAKIKGEL